MLILQVMLVTLPFYLKPHIVCQFLTGVLLHVMASDRKLKGKDFFLLNHRVFLLLEVSQTDWFKDSVEIKLELETEIQILLKR